LWALRQVGADYWALNVVAATIFTVGLAHFSLRLPNPYLALAVAFPYLVIAVGMSGIRQGCAIGFAFYAFSAFSRRRYLTCVVALLVGSLFHASCILLLGIVAVAMVRNTAGSLAILSLTLTMGAFVLDSDFDKYLERYSDRNVQSGGVGFRLLMNVVPALVFLWNKKKFQGDSNYLRLWQTLSYLALALLPLLLVVPSTTALDRISLYVVPLQIFVLASFPTIMSRSSPQTEATWRLAIVGYLATALVVFLFFATFAAGWVPYKSYLLGDG
jgi:hypothetical protein